MNEETLSTIKIRRELMSPSDTSIGEHQNDDPTQATDQITPQSCPYPNCDYKTKKRMIYTNSPNDRMKSHMKKFHPSSFNETTKMGDIITKRNGIKARATKRNLEGKGSTPTNVALEKNDKNSQGHSNVKEIKGKRAATITRGLLRTNKSKTKALETQTKGKKIATINQSILHTNKSNTKALHIAINKNNIATINQRLLMTNKSKRKALQIQRSTMNMPRLISKSAPQTLKKETIKRSIVTEKSNSVVQNTSESIKRRSVSEKLIHGSQNRTLSQSIKHPRRVRKFLSTSGPISPVKQEYESEIKPKIQSAFKEIEEVTLKCKEKLENSLESLLRQNHILVKEKQEITAELAVTLKCKQELENSLDSLLLKNQILVKEKQEITDELAACRNKGIAKDIALEDNMKQIASLKKTIEVKQNFVDSAISRQESLNKAVSENNLLKAQLRESKAADEKETEKNEMMLTINSLNQSISEKDLEYQEALNKAVNETNLLKVQLKKYTDIDAEKETEKNQMIMEITSLKESILEKEQLCQEANAKIENALASVTKYQTELHASLNLQEDLRNEFETSKAAYHLEKQKLQEEIKSLKTHLVTREKQALKERAESTTRSLQFESEYNRMKSRLQEVEEEFDTIKTNSKSLELKNNALKHTEQYITKKIKEQNQIIEKVERERDSAMEQVLKLQEEGKVAQEELNSSYKKQEEFARKLGLKYYNARGNIVDSKKEDDKPINEANGQISSPIEEDTNNPNSIAYWKEEAENLRWFCYQKEREIDSIEGLKTELMIQDDIKSKEISQLREKLKASSQRAEELQMDNYRLGGKK